ncbi:amino acid adenylation domain-containing protein [Pseudomonas sp. 10B1]|uniref:non-ribosomal peptide synthetase n=3 Tax=Pseudomonas TaxID=286 RepID=UPI002B22A695|nr:MULTISPECIES: non-ribosomal peptide synthetase [unclassified Pseudomonas]MEA9997081.1 amino acid adenylation domain-containing protein [Pseudomonas sp. AA4]MEB0087721.1 amino acid adenylation domain-containing protein [Pseudomonas sp. RTI1]MEB0124843.1 amino acid adenylation domain-containing protein [Pseudomonas sp. CCC1.2]MEB0311653.1 amino acid adenylation domain-containing protein [Pseudomonas sp. 10B1]
MSQVIGTYGETLAQKLREHLSQVLNLSNVGIDEALTEHWGDDLPLQELVRETRRFSKVVITPLDVLGCATIKALADLIVRKNGQGTVPSTNTATEDKQQPVHSGQDAYVDDHESNVAASLAQEDLWLVDQIEGSSTAYNLSTALRSDKSLNAEVMNQAIAQVVRRHAALRTILERDQRGLRQVVATEARFEWSTVSLDDAVGSGSREEQLHLRLAAFARKNFDLASGPLIRACLYRMNTDDFVVQFVVHHAVFDAWSSVVVSREIETVYNSLDSGLALKLASTGAEPGAFARWHNARLTPTRLAQLRHYWSTQLAALPQVIDLPTDFLRPRVRSSDGAKFTKVLSPALAEQIAAVGGKWSASLFMTLMAAWQLLLWRYSRQTEFAIGTPMATRDADGFESTVGYFVNTVVIRGQVVPTERFDELLQRVVHVTLAAYEHKDLPLRQVVDLASRERTLSNSPLFQVMLEFHNELQDEEGTEPTNLRPVTHDIGVAKYDLSLEIANTGDGLVCSIEYATSLFDVSTIEGMLAQYEVLLQQIVATPTAVVSRLTCVPKGELEKVVSLWNATELSQATPACIHQLFEARVKERPDAIAVRFGNQSLTYCELNRRVDELAGRLRRNIQGCDVKIAICLDRSVEMPVAILAVLKAGAAYVPIDTHLPAERIDFMLTDSAAAFVLTVVTIREEKFAAKPIKVMCIDESVSVEDEQHTKHHAPETLPESVAYVMYTSGSTGTPKGVVVTHSNVTHLLYAMQARYPLKSEDCYLLKTNYAFDVSVPELFGWFVGAGSLVILPPQFEGSPDLIAEEMIQHAVTHVNFTPSMLRPFVTEVSASDRFQNNHCLKYVFVAGEELSKDLACDALSALRPAAIENLYGPTEATVFATSHSCASAVSSTKIPIGRPFANVRTYVLDEHMLPAPIGVPGDLYLAGCGVAAGYLNRPDLSEERFLPDPFARDGRLYKTGDLARWLRSGAIEYLGRDDQQVKIRGYRIELDEIAGVLNAHTLVSEAAVLAQGAEGGQARLVAYVVPFGDMEGEVLTASRASTLLAQTLTEAIKLRLPEYMVPASFVFTASLPKGITGKLNRKKLETMNGEVRPECSALVTARNEIESLLCEIWKSVLRIPEIGVTDNFFAAGGDSILSIQVASRARQQGMKLSARDVFQHQTIERLAANVRGTVRTPSQQPSVQTMPLLPIHQRFLGLDAEQVNHYHQSRLLDVPVDLDCTFLTAWLSALFLRHDALRMRLQKREGKWTGEFVPMAGLHVHASLETRHFAHSGNVSQDIDTFFSDARACINLSDGPLFKAALATRDRQYTSRLLLICHHAVVDGVSWRIILEDLRHAYSQWQATESISLQDKTDSYQAWANEIVAQRNAPSLLAERDYWLKTLAQPVPQLPIDHGVASDSTRRFRRIEVACLSAQTTATLLTESHHAYQTHINELMLTALSLAVYRWTGHEAVRIALEGHGRETYALSQYAGAPDELDVSQTVGWFTSYYPLVLKLNNAVMSRNRLRNEQVASAVMAIKELYRTIPRHGFGYGILRHVLADPSLTEAEEASPAEIVFNYLGQVDTHGDETAGISVLNIVASNDIGEQRRREHRLGMNGEVKNGRLAFEIDYSSEEFEKQTIQTFASLFVDALSEIAAHCKELPTLWRPTPADFPLASVTADEICAWRERYPALENLYPATGMQVGMVFHSLMPDHASAYTNQVFMSFTGSFEPKLFKAAWQLVIDRHPVLRTAFVGFDREQPMQAVLSHVECPWREVDHRQLNAQQQFVAFHAMLVADKSRPFDFAYASHFRLTLVDRGAQGYRFVWTYHHGILDGWSVSLIWTEVFTAYESLHAGCAPTLQPVQSFGHFIEWRQRRSQDEDRRYWRSVLGNLASRTTLGIEQHELESSVVASPVLRRELNEQDTRRLADTARACHITLSAMLQAAWALLLCQYSGDQDVVFGVTVSGRSIDLPGVETIVGPLINTVPARLKIEPDLSLRDWLRSVHDAHIEREEHSSLDLLQIRRESAIANGQSLFDSVLIVENYPAVSLDSNELLGLTDYGYAEETHYGLTVSAKPGKRLGLEIAFNPSRFHIKDVHSMADKFETALLNIPNRLDEPAGTALGRSDTALAACDIETDGMEVSCTLRQGDLRLGRLLVPHLVEDHAASTPNKQALVFNEYSYSYDDLNRAANRLANSLLLSFPHLGTDALIAVRMPRSDRLIVTILAIWKIGAAYIPVDPVLPEQRVREMLQIAEAKLLIEDTDVAAFATPITDVHIAAYGALMEGIQTCDENPDIYVSAHDLSYVLFTSGSTGKPKGAMVEHIGVLNNIANKAIDLEMSEASRVVQNALMSFDVSVWQMFIALTQGGTTFVYDERVVNDIAGFIGRLLKDQITVLEVVPTYLLVLIEFLEERPLQRPALELQFLLVTGEAVDASLLRRWFKLFPTSKAVNAYGPTEASDDITHHVMTADDVIVNPVPVGRALANFDIYVVDDELRPVPFGVKGEIVVSGVGIGRGYVGMAGATAKAFVESPFRDKYKGRLYRTGDIGVMRPNGVLLYHGRKDNQVKIRGMRIELGEVESNLLKISAVRQAAVLDIRPEGREAFLCAYVVQRNEGDRENIIDELKAKLPPFMVPSVFRFATHLPELQSGKVDRRTLLAQFQDDAPRSEYVEPTTDIERHLADIWCGVLANPAVGIHDDFFEVGGDSFKAIRIAAKYGPQLEVMDIYNFPTIETLAAHLALRSDNAQRILVPMSGDLGSAEAVVVCFANSAGGPVNFIETGRAMAALPRKLALYAVKFPRNDAGSVAAMIDEVTRLTNEICDGLLKETTLPIIVFAQCNGSALAISVARELKKRSANLRGLCIGGALMRTALSAKDLRTDREVISFLGSVGSTLPVRPDELAFFMHDFRYDCSMADGYYNHLVGDIERNALENLHIPVWCLVGTEDQLVPGYQQRFQDWNHLGTHTRLVEYPGVGHYLLRDCPERVASSLQELWESVVMVEAK